MKRGRRTERIDASRPFSKKPHPMGCYNFPFSSSGTTPCSLSLLSFPSQRFAQIFHCWRASRRLGNPLPLSVAVRGLASSPQPSLSPPPSLHSFPYPPTQPPFNSTQNGRTYPPLLFLPSFLARAELFLCMDGFSSDEAEDLDLLPELLLPNNDPTPPPLLPNRLVELPPPLLPPLLLLEEECSLT